MSKGWLYAWGLGSVAFGGASLVVPLYVVFLGGGPATLGALAAVAAFVGVPGALVVGRLADRTGKRRAYVLGALAITAGTLVAMPFVASIPLVIVANGVIWFAFAAATPVVTLLAVAGAPEYAWSERIARLNTYQGVGWALGLLLGTVVTVVAIGFVDPLTAVRGFFVVTAAFAAAGLVAAARSVPPDPAVLDAVSGDRLRRAIRRGNRYSVRAATFPFTVGRTSFEGLHPRLFVDRFTPTLALYFGAVVLVFAGSAAFFAPLPAFLAETGYGAGEIFALYLLSSVAAALCFDAVGTLAGRRDASVVQSVGLGVRAVCIPAVAVIGGALGSATLGFAVVAVAFTVIGATWAVIAVTAGTLVTRVAPSAIRGEALGVYAAVSALAGGLGSLLGGWLAAVSYPLAFLVAGVLVGVAAVGVFALRTRTATPGRSADRVESLLE